MKLSEAKREFEIRCFYWHVSEIEKEIKNSFPNLRLFKSGSGWKLHHFMQRLNPSEQLMLARGKLKIGYSASTLEDMGESISEEEKDLAESFHQFAWELSDLEIEIQSRKQAGEKIKFANKRKLRKATVTKFIETFGSQCADMKIGEEWDPQFHMKCCGWIINTQLVFGRTQGLVTYRHVIESEVRIKHPKFAQFTFPAVTLSPGFAWLENRWQEVMDSDVDSVSTAVIKHTGFFFEAAPILLKGLEFDQIDTTC